MTIHSKHLAHARFLAENYSDDPTRQVGAIIRSEGSKKISVGWNANPSRGVQGESRKYIHAEIMAIAQAGWLVCEDAVLYVWPFQPCLKCAPIIADTGIRVIYTTPFIPSTHTEEFKEAASVLESAGITLEFILDDTLRHDYDGDSGQTEKGRPPTSHR